MVVHICKPGFGNLKWKEHDLEASLGYSGRLSPKPKPAKENRTGTVCTAVWETVLFSSLMTSVLCEYKGRKVAVIYLLLFFLHPLFSLQGLAM